MTQPLFPLVVAEEGDIWCYDSLAAAEMNLEAPDVLDGIYKGWDAREPLHKYA